MQDKQPNDNTVNKILSTVKKNNRRHSEDFKNDPNYECRVATITKEKIYPDGRKVLRTSTKVLDKPKAKSGIYDLPQKVRTHIHLLGNTSYMFGQSNKKHPRIVSNSPKFKKVKGKRIQVRAIPFRTLTKTAVECIKQGMSKVLYNSFGKIDKMYLKTALKFNQHKKTNGWSNPMKGRWLNHYNKLNKILDGNNGYGAATGIEPATN